MAAIVRCRFVHYRCVAAPNHKGFNIVAIHIFYLQAAKGFSGILMILLSLKLSQLAFTITVELWFLFVFAKQLGKQAGVVLVNGIENIAFHQAQQQDAY